jgi:hypothetical protein
MSDLLFPTKVSVTSTEGRSFEFLALNSESLNRIKEFALKGLLSGYDNIGSYKIDQVVLDEYWSLTIRVKSPYHDARRIVTTKEMKKYVEKGHPLGTIVEMCRVTDGGIISSSVATSVDCLNSQRISYKY